MDWEYIYLFENCVLSYQTIPHNILQHRCQNTSAVTTSNPIATTVVFIGDDTKKRKEQEPYHRLLAQVLTPGQPLSNPWPLQENPLVAAVFIYVLTAVVPFRVSLTLSFSQFSLKYNHKGKYEMLYCTQIIFIYFDCTFEVFWHHNSIINTLTTKIA